MNEGANYLGQVIKELAISVAVQMDRAAKAEAEVARLTEELKKKENPDG